MNVKKLLLLLLLVILLVLSIPELRESAQPVIDPAGEWLAEVSEPLVLKVTQPFLRWKAQDEARALAKLLQDQEAVGAALPRPREFQLFLRRRWIVSREGLDPWRVPYYLEYTPQEVVVGSAGPDLEPRTGDDIRVGFPRRLR